MVYGYHDSRYLKCRASLLRHRSRARSSSRRRRCCRCRHHYATRLHTGSMRFDGLVDSR